MSYQPRMRNLATSGLTIATLGLALASIGLGLGYGSGTQAFEWSGLIFMEVSAGLLIYTLLPLRETFIHRKGIAPLVTGVGWMVIAVYQMFDPEDTAFLVRLGHCLQYAGWGVVGLTLWRWTVVLQRGAARAQTGGAS